MQLRKIKWRQWCGVAGVHPDESVAVLRSWYVAQTVIFLISVWLLIQLYLDLNHVIAAGARTIILWVLWAVFVVEVLVMLAITKHRLYYLCGNWFVILIMLAAFPIFWSFSSYIAAIRFFQVLVVFLLLMPWFTLTSFFSQHYLGWMLLIFVAFSVCCGLLLGFLDPGIGSPWVGVWWGFQTLTLVGYGNIVPNTVIGQVFSIIIMIMGILTVALLSASLIWSFGKGRGSKDSSTPGSYEDEVLRQLDEIKQDVRDLKKSQKK